MQEHVRLLKCNFEYSKGKGKEIGNDFCMKSRRILNVYGTLMAPKLYWVLVLGACQNSLEHFDIRCVVAHV